MSTWNPSIPTCSTSSCELQEVHGSRTGLEAPSRKLKVTLLSSEWKSTKGGLSTINRELAIQLAKHQNVEVSMYLPECSEEDVTIAGKNHVKLLQAKELIGYEPIEWLSSAPENHEMDYVIGHGLILGRQVQLIQKQLTCKWVQVVHTAPEDLGMFKGYANAISRAEKKHKAELLLCESADQVVAVGPKLADEYKCYLRYSKRDQSVFVLTPSIFSEFSVVQQAAEERDKFRVLVFGRGDNEDFELKGYDIAAKAFSKLKKKPYQLIFVGAPLGKEEEVADKLCQHGIARKQLKVRPFKESRENLVRLFCEVDLCIMPSRTEGFGLAALEALSAGLPILVSGNSGLGDALQNVPHGSSCVVNSEDPREWADAIKRVRKKRRDVRLKETKDLCIQYAEEYRWEKQCGELVGRMLDSISGTHQATEGEQDSPLTRSHLPTAMVCEACVEPTDKKGKRPLHPSVIPPSKKQRHDTDICIEIHHASLEEEASSVTRSHLETTVDTQARNLCGGISERQTAEMQQRHVTDTHKAGIADSVVVKLLRQEYKRRAEFRPLLWNTGKGMKLHLDEVYTRLKIVARPKGLEDAEIDLEVILFSNLEETTASLNWLPWDL
ncbi:D-inositol 3-phosphate glycosyltransferase-like [Montipora foliosa]|uniref:D-inositol 3-phosphate glycosyltransferase-like n=1 Tax=Montipora foliosa TaxID=591990 RepID=UPI0035F218D3